MAVTAEMIRTVILGLYSSFVADWAALNILLMRIQFSTVCVYSALALTQGLSGIGMLMALMPVNGVVAGFAQPASQAAISGFANMIGSTSVKVPLAIRGTLVAVFGAFVFVGALAVGGVASQTVLQPGTPPNPRGRVMLCHHIVFRVCPALGAVMLGGHGNFQNLQKALPLGIAALLVLCV